MIRNLKALGLALVAVLAMSAVAASGASATGQVTAPEGYPVSLTGIQLGANTLSVGAGVRTVSCAEAELTSTLGAASTTVTAAAKYNACTGNGETTATVNMTSCDYTLSSATVSGNTGTGHVTIDCSTAGDAIHVEIYEKGVAHETSKMMCGYTITAGKLEGTFTWHNKNVGTATEDIELTLAGLKLPESQVHITHAKSAILCGKAAGNTITASYSGNITVTGSAASVHKKVMIG